MGRSFYMRKVKFTQTNFSEKLSMILTEFPKLEDIHPFYADLMNVLYDKDHYKLALGQINTARHLIDSVSKDYVRLLKFGDSLYRCKQLKRAALGRMATVMRRQNQSLGYLEQVRQHLSRLPTIDPNTRTLLITGFPNVGKSSFINKISRADVDVQPYAFTTKSLFVGHTDYKYVRWQVIDTPGILDHPLEDRNTIEMQAVTALAHLQSAVLFFVDISVQCGYTIKQQVSLYHSIKPLFQNKPTLIVLNKIDQVKFEDLDDEDRVLINSMSEGRNDVEALQMSALTEEGVTNVKHRACDILLEFRVEKKLRRAGSNILNRIQVQQPTKRDEKVRSVNIPESVLRRRRNKEPKAKRKTQKDYQDEGEGAGVYGADHRLEWLAVREEWRHDVVPEILDGKNIVDFIDPEIEKRLEELEAEETILQRKAEAEALEEPDSDLDEADKELLAKIRKKVAKIRSKSKMMRSMNHPVLPRKVRGRNLTDVEKNLQSIGLDTSKYSERTRSRSRGRKRTRSMDASMVDDDDGARKRGRSKLKSEKLRSASVKRRSKSRDATAFSDISERKKADKILKKSQKPRNREARVGEADRTFAQKMPKHLFSGKRGIGKNSSPMMLHYYYYFFIFMYMSSLFFLLFSSLLSIHFELLYTFFLGIFNFSQ